jgi:DNA-binding transcriptional ArsR family regulator
LRGRVDDSDVTRDSQAVSDAFAALGDETRVAILEAFVEARRGDPQDPALSFSEVRERAGVEDSGRFNYHLGKLRPRFLEERDDGYELTYAGREVVGAILSGMPDPDLVRGPEPLDDDCPICGDGLRGEYVDGDVSVECEREHTMIVATLPPAAAADRTLSEIVALTARRLYSQLELVTAGVCHICSGPLERAIEAADGDGEVSDFAYWTQCERCGETTSSIPTVAVLHDPAFVSLLHDHGVDVRERLPWTIPGLLDAETRRTGEDPPQYELAVEVNDDVLEVTLDERGDVAATEILFSE